MITNTEQKVENLRNKNIMLAVFAITTGLFWFSLYAYVPELSTHAKTLGASYKFIGIILGSYGFTQMILRIPLGIFSDFIGKRKIFIVLGLFCSFISSILTFINPNEISLFLTRSLAGVSAATWVLFTVLFSSYFNSHKSTKSIGIINSFNAIGQISAMLLGGLVSWIWGTRYLFLLSAVAALIGFTLSIFITEIKIERKRFNFNDFIKVIKNKKLLVASFLAILSQLITFATIFGFVPIIANEFNAKSIELSFLSLIAVVPAVVISVLSSDLFLKLIGRRKTLTIGFLISSILCIIIPFAKSIEFLYIAQFLAGIGRSMVFPLLMGTAVEGIDIKIKATAMGFYQALYGVGMVFGPVFLGFIAEFYGLNAGFIFTGFIGLIAMIIIKITSIE
jgi:MFS family permease